MDTILFYLYATGAVLVGFTLVHLFLDLIIWANSHIRYHILKSRRLTPIFRILFLSHEKTVRDHEEEILEFIRKLEENGRRRK